MDIGLKDLIGVLDELWASGMEEPDNPVSKGLRFGARQIAIGIGQQSRDTNVKGRLLAWATAHKI